MASPKKRRIIKNARAQRIKELQAPKVEVPEVEIAIEPEVVVDAAPVEPPKPAVKIKPAVKAKPRPKTKTKAVNKAKKSTYKAKKED